MEYPGSTLTKRWRRAILMVFILLFFIISPSVVLYTSGYRFDIKNGLVKQVGVLSIDGKPLATTVAINGLKQSGHIPSKFANLLPGSYQLTLSAPGYHPIEETIFIRAKETTYIKDIDLNLNQQPEQIITYLPPATAILKDAQMIAYTSTTASGTVVFFQKINSKAYAITTTNRGIDELRISPHEEYVAALQHNIPIFFIKTKTFEVFSPHMSHPASGGKNTTWYWDTEGSDLFIYQQNGSTVSAVDLQNETVLSTTAIPETESWFPYQYQIWHITTNEPGLAIYSSSTNLFFNRENEWNKNLRSWTKGKSWQAYSSYNNTVFLKNTAQTETAVISRTSAFTLPVTTLHHESGQKKTLLYGPFEVWKYSANDTEPIFIYRSSEPLRAAESMNDTDLYLLATNRTLFSYQYLHSISTNLAHDVEITQAWTLPQKRTIIFTGTYHKTPGVWKLAY